MPSTTALFTALTGLNANARQIDVIGNNVANVNTTAFKSSRLLFSTVMPRTISNGTQPRDTTGGTNPHQIGLGVNTAGTQRNTNPGTISSSGDLRDLAIDGAGFFVVNRNGEELYTRAGAFRTNSENQLTSISGERLRGYGVDEDFNLNTGTLVDITVPLSSLTIAQATEVVRFAGNLDADGDMPTTGTSISLSGTATAGLRTIAAAAPAPAPGNLVEDTTRLVDIEDPLLVGSGTPLFVDGQFFEVRGAEKGGRVLPSSALAITGTTTIADLRAFLADTLGINTTTGANPNGATPGIALDPVAGILTVTGNTGTTNDLSVDATDMRLLSSTGTVSRYPLVPAKSVAANGESVRTTFIAYDSLGTPVEIDMAMTLDSRDSTGTTWRYFIESPDQGTFALPVGTGTLSFDNLGQLTTTASVTATLDRSGTGAATPLTFSISFSSDEGSLTALTDDDSNLSAIFRDGSPIGTLSGYSIGTDGMITGSFTNGLTRTLGQVALATFTNPEGLSEVGGNMFRTAANSGTPILTTPGDFGTGPLVTGALELSNVDLGEEFIKLVLSQTGYSANARIVKTTDELMQQLLVLGR